MAESRWGPAKLEIDLELKTEKAKKQLRDFLDLQAYNSLNGLPSPDPRRFDARDMRSQSREMDRLLQASRFASDPDAVAARVKMEKKINAQAKELADQERYRHNAMNEARKKAGLAPVLSDEEKEAKKKAAIDEKEQARLDRVERRQAIAAGKKTAGVILGGSSAVLGEAGAAAGGAIGTAVGGPMGGAIGEELGKKVGEAIPGLIKSTVGAPLKVTAAGMQLLSDTLGDLNGQLGPVDAGLNLMGKGLSGVATILGNLPGVGIVLGPLAEQFAVLPGIFQGLLGTLTQFAGVANPATLDRFNYAVKDVQAVIGRAFVPALDVMRDGVRLFGDVLANILPDTLEVSQVFESFRKEFNVFGDQIRDSMRVLGPLFREGFLMAIRFPLTLLAGLFRSLGTAASALAVQMRPLLSVLGIQESDIRGSTGAAARPAQIQSFSEYQRKLQIEAFSIPGDAQADPLPGIADNVKRIDQNITNLVSVLSSGLKGEVNTAVELAADLAQFGPLRRLAAEGGDAILAPLGLGRRRR